MLWSIFLVFIIFEQGAAKCTNGTTVLVAESNKPQHLKYPQSRTDYPRISDSCAINGVNQKANQDICWRISTGGESVLISITATIISNDYIRIYDGTDDTGTKIYEEHGKTDNTRKLVATSGNAFIWFDSDNTATIGGDEGFFLYFVSGTGTDCNKDLPTATLSDNYLTSPNFPGEYGLDSTCTWAIEASSHSAGLEVEILFMDIEYRPSCDYDYLQINDDLGEGTDTMCGTDWFPSKKYITQNSLIQIKLVRDSKIAKHGFALVYRETDPLVDISLIILSILLITFSLFICIFGSLYCVDKL